MEFAPDEPRVAVIIEDEDDIRELLETILAQAGFRTITTRSGVEGIRAVHEHSPLVTTLDVSMPGMDGFEVAKRIRAFSSTYIFMLTARSDEIDTLQGLEAGADDYITKPFRPRELRARIEAVLRRHHPVMLTAGYAIPEQPGHENVIVVLPQQSPYDSRTDPYATPLPMRFPESAGFAEAVAAAAAAASESKTLSSRAAEVMEAEVIKEAWMEHNGLRLMPEMRLVECDGVELNLTRTEFDLMASLMSSQRRVRSKADLALLLRGESYVTAYFVNEADKRAVETHISNLRRKLGDGLSSPRWVETVRGIGYRLAAVQVN